MSLDGAILGFLDKRPRSGYDLKTRSFDGEVKDLWTADQAQIYRTLERLQAAKLVSAARKHQAGKPDRKVYSITELGQRALSTWLDSSLPLPPPRDAFLLQLYLGAELSDVQLAEHLSDRRRLHQDRLDDLRRRAQQVAQEGESSLRGAALRNAAFDGAIAVQRAAIDWLDDCLEGLAAGTLPPIAAESEEGPLFGPTTA